ncbi:MAG: polyribonucleotide nucleotidyltransferase [Ignavibacteria bacterium]|nr:polyribonucleotide nucleotidyltransferase [Ignavibacteria bacterium]
MEHNPTESVVVKIDFDGKELSLEAGKFAKFANGSVMVKYDQTMVLVTAVASDTEREDIDFLPLQVEYREKSSSAGKIPGGFIKREGKPTEREILSARLIDRPIRPLIPKSWRYETQIIATVFSSQPDIDPDVLGMIGASASLLISDIPFNGPISEVRVGRLNGKFKANPSIEELKNSDMDLTVAGTDTSIVMVEGEAKEISEEDFLSALEFAHEKIRIINKLQADLFEKIRKPKREYKEIIYSDELVNSIKEAIKEDLNEYIHTITTKKERKDWRERFLQKALEIVVDKFGTLEEYANFDFQRAVINIVNEIEKEAMRNMILSEGRRLDGRGLKEIRPIHCEVGLLPRTHGSSLFTRGETQALCTTTLGTKDDEQILDGILPIFTSRFMLHYNFPPFCTGEVGKLTGVSRREIGHGNLAERALKNMLPEQDVFPYTIRVVSDILESNGSSSMATVCAGSLSLFDAGVPLKKHVAGIAMGLIKEGDNVAILTDILGDEDHLGDMDFKVAGTRDGITACQMDIKIEGISIDIMRRALEQAREARMFVLDLMYKTISEPRPDLSPYAPRYKFIKIPTDMIGLVIGPGGEKIRSISKETNTSLFIEEDGTVQIVSSNKEDAQRAAEMIESLVRKPEIGDVYKGEVKEIREGLGAIVEFLPKKTGLLHISHIDHKRIEKISDVLSVGDKIDVMLIEMTGDGKYKLSRKALLPKPQTQQGVKHFTYPNNPKPNR